MGTRGDIRRRIERLERETQPEVSQAAVAEALTLKLTEFIRDRERVQRAVGDPENPLGHVLRQMVEWRRERLGNPASAADPSEPGGWGRNRE